MMRFLEFQTRNINMCLPFDVGASLESEKNAMQTTKRGKRVVKVKYLICTDFSNH